MYFQTQLPILDFSKNLSKDPALLELDHFWEFFIVSPSVKLVLFWENLSQGSSQPEIWTSQGSPFQIPTSFTETLLIIINLDFSGNIFQGPSKIQIHTFLKIFSSNILLNRDLIENVVIQTVQTWRCFVEKCEQSIRIILDL